jgi:hypothetical protein
VAQLKPNDPNSQLRMVHAKQGLCDCLKKKYGGTLPPALREFCDPKTANRPSSPPVETAMAPRFETSRVVLIGGPQTIRGSFDGDMTNTHVRIGEQACTIASETAGEVTWQAPEGVKPGAATVSVQEGTTRASFPVAVLGLTLSAARLHLLRGESTTLVATVNGFDGMPVDAWAAGAAPKTVDAAWLRRLAPGFKPPREGQAGVLLLVLENASAGTVSLAGAKNEAIVLTIDRAAVKAGQYQFQTKIHSKRTGNFDIRATLVPYFANVSH